MLDFGARFYDPSICRFTGVDPISEQFPHVTTYNYAENKPITFVDLWGLQAAHNSITLYSKTVQKSRGVNPDVENGFMDGAAIAAGAVVDEIPVLGETVSISNGDFAGAMLGSIPGGKFAKKLFDKGKGYLKSFFNKGGDEVLDIHRIGGGDVENLVLKEAEKKLDPPGISVLKSDDPSKAAKQMRDEFPNATRLHEASKTVGSTNADKIRASGFDIIAKRTKSFPNHHRITHPDGVEGFSKENLEKLSESFKNTGGN